MATNQELIDNAMSRLGRRNSVPLRADVVSEINNAIDNLERGTFFPWFLEKTASLSIVEDDTSVALPSDFALEAEDTRPYYTLDSTVYYLTKRFPAALQSEVPTTLKYYAIHGSNFLFRKAADQAYTISLHYYSRTNDPIADNTNNVSNLWLLNAKDWALAMALKKVAAFVIRDLNLAQTMAAEELRAKNDLYVYHIARQAENQDFEVGGASDGT